MWGAFATTSVHLNGAPFAQPKSFSEGFGKNESTGVLYFYDSDMDTSVQDAVANNVVSFTLSEAQIDECKGKFSGEDPESPLCARVVFTGSFDKVTDEEENEKALAGMFERHPVMKTWPGDHSFYLHKLTITDIWLISFYGGASIIEPDDYFGAKV